MSRRLKVFIALALLQLAVPVYMITHYEEIMQKGKTYTWATEPVDPYDALRGRYVSLGFRGLKVPVAGGETLHRGQRVYGIVTENEQGLAGLSELVLQPPADRDYVKVKVAYASTANTAVVSLPFKRYYMEEGLAPRAEEVYRRQSGKAAQVKVRLYQGDGVVDELYVGGLPIREYLLQQRQ